MDGRQRIEACVAAARASGMAGSPSGGTGFATDRLPFVPITMMFSADLIGVLYRDYATDWRLLVEGQMAVADRFGADHVSVISDPAVEASDLGSGVVFPEDSPPANDSDRALFMDKAALGQAAMIDPGSGARMSNRLEAVAALARRTGDTLAVEGWVEGPCAEAADLRGLSRLMMDFYDDPDFVEDLVEFVTAQEIAFACAQVQAGATMIGVGDAASSLIGPALFATFMAPQHRRYVEAIHATGALARLHICGNSAPLMESIATLGYDIVDLDSQSPVAHARSRLGPGTVILGNIDTVTLVRGGSPEDIKSALSACARDAGYSAYIVGAGCEIPRDSPAANVLAMRDFAQSFRP